MLAISMLIPVSLRTLGQPGPDSRGHPQLDPRSRQSPWGLDCHRWSGAFPGTHNGNTHTDDCCKVRLMVQYLNHEVLEECEYGILLVL